jgi:hypothetical protein
MEIGFNYWVFDKFEEIWYYGTYETDSFRDNIWFYDITNGTRHNYIAKNWLGHYVMDEKNIPHIPRRL